MNNMNPFKLFITIALFTISYQLIEETQNMGPSAVGMWFLILSYLTGLAAIATAVDFLLDVYNK